MLIAVCLTDVLLPRLNGVPATATLNSTQSDGAGRAGTARRDVVSRCLLGYLLCWGIVAGLGAGLDEQSPLHALDGSEQAAMRWAAANTPAESRFLVITGRQPWLDAVSEWFPVVSGRSSVATVQGSEWLGRSVFTNRIEAARELQRCALSDTSCIERWAARFGDDFTHVYVPRTNPLDQRYGADDATDCCLGLRQSLGRSSAYAVLYDGAGGTIAVRRATANGP
jgi:hypothetical protein